MLYFVKIPNINRILWNDTCIYQNQIFKCIELEIWIAFSSIRNPAIYDIETLSFNSFTNIDMGLCKVKQFNSEPENQNHPLVFWFFDTLVLWFQICFQICFEIDTLNGTCWIGEVQFWIGNTKTEEKLFWIWNTNR